MMKGMTNTREVWAGAAGEVRWKILVERGAKGEVFSFVLREVGLAHATSGMGGPALPPGHMVKVVDWRCHRMPDHTAAAAFALTVSAGGGVTTKTAVLLTLEEVDAAAAKQVGYRPPRFLDADPNATSEPVDSVRSDRTLSERAFMSPAAHIGIPDARARPRRRLPARRGGVMLTSA